MIYICMILACVKLAHKPSDQEETVSRGGDAIFKYMGEGCRQYSIPYGRDTDDNPKALEPCNLSYRNDKGKTFLFSQTREVPGNISAVVFSYNDKHVEWPVNNNEVNFKSPYVVIFDIWYMSKDSSRREEVFMEDYRNHCSSDEFCCSSKIDRGVGVSKGMYRVFGFKNNNSLVDKGLDIICGEESPSLIAVMVPGFEEKREKIDFKVNVDGYSERDISITPEGKEELSVISLQIIRKSSSP